MHVSRRVRQAKQPAKKQNQERPDTELQPMIAVFYDCCVPQALFKKLIRLTARFAYHHFLSGDDSKDYTLFTHVDERRQKEYPELPCYFVTFDKHFGDEVRKHPALNTTLHLIILNINADSTTKAVKKRVAREFIHMLCDIYLDILEHQIK